MSDEVIAMLVVPNEYVRNINQVAGLTTHDILFLRRKFVSKSGYELEKQPIDQCGSMAYFDERPLTTIVSGALLSALILFIVVMLVVNWNDLQAGTKLPIGALGTVGLLGVQRMFKARRHRLVFTTQDQTKLTWASRPGEHELWKQSVQQILDFARTRRLLAGG